jgi:hypothetical protein
MDNAIIRPLTQQQYVNTTNRSTFGGNKLVMVTHTGTTGQYHVISCDKASVNVIANTTGFSNTSETIIISAANSLFKVGDKVFYGVPTSNTRINGITSANAYYFISFTNSTSIALSATFGGANLNITDNRTTTPGEVHTIALNKYQIDLTGGQNIILEKDPTDTIGSDDTAAVTSATAIAYRN